MKISIITVTYNRGYIIKDAIEGVLRQRYHNYEYIVVDGDSTDNTVELLKEYEPKFEGRMRWISEPDNGLYDAINKGIKMATGDVVGIINSDDFFHRDDTIEIIAKAFDKGPSLECVFGDNRLIKPENPDVNYRFHCAWYFRPWMFRIGIEPPHPSFYAKKECFDKWGYYKTDYFISADFELMMRFMLINKAKWKYLHHTFLTFRVTGISTDSNNRKRMNKEIVRACKENGIWTCAPLVWCKYIFRIPELFIYKHRK